MQKHRKKRHYKAMAIGAVTLGVVGIPVALAGLGTEEAGAAQAAPAAVAPAAAADKAAAKKKTAAENVVALVNKERAKVGCRAVKINKKLTTAALKHSKDMAAHRNMSHTGSDGSNPGQRITRAGYQWRTYGENVAYGYTTSTKVMKGWMNSPGHKANILNCSFKEIGVARAQPGNYWTQVFGTRL